MSNLIESAIRKYLNPQTNGATNRNFYSKLKILIELIKVLYYLIENRRKQSLERQIYRDEKLQNFGKVIEENIINVRQWAIMLQEQRSCFINFQRKIKLNLKAIEFLKANTRNNLEHILTMQIGEFLSKLLHKNYKCNIKRGSLKKEAELHESHLKCMNKVHNFQEHDLHNVHFIVKKQCLDQLRIYDETIKMLYTYKTALLRDKKDLEKDYSFIQSQLFEQLSLYNQLKEERELNATRAFLAQVERFRLNHAAKVIQRSWRSYCRRAFSKKKKGRK